MDKRRSYEEYDRGQQQQGYVPMTQEQYKRPRYEYNQTYQATASINYNLGGVQQP